jgi:hypothetical protein
MKTLQSFIILFFASTLAAVAQTSGIYLSASDFATGKLAYSIDCSKEKHKIKLNEFLNKDFITVIHNKQSHDLLKKDIFGYKDCSDVAYRFVGNSHYTILNPAEEILLYKHILIGSKSHPSETHYYFSLSGSSEVQQLTLNNLKSATPDNHKFHDALDMEFKSDDELTDYDSFHKIYKINRLYSNNKI